MEEQKLEQLNGILSKWKFKEAKTFAKVAPHEYIVLIPSRDRVLWNLMENCIAEFGVDEPFRIFQTVKTYRYLYLNGYKYWKIEQIINRVKV